MELRSFTVRDLHCRWLTLPENGRPKNRGFTSAGIQHAQTNTRGRPPKLINMQDYDTALYENVEDLVF